MDKVQKYNSFNTNTPSSESYRNYLQITLPWRKAVHLQQWFSCCGSRSQWEFATCSRGSMEKKKKPNGELVCVFLRKEFGNYKHEAETSYLLV